MAKPRKKSKTIRDHKIMAFTTALSGAVLVLSPEIRASVPNWVYVPLMLAVNAYGIWRREQTIEPIQKEESEQ